MPRIETKKYEIQRTTYAARKAAGKCPHCGVRKPMDGYVSCAPCRMRHRGYTRHFNSRRRAMKAQGIEIVRCVCRKRAMILCTACQASLCDTCYDVGEGLCRDCLAASEEEQHGA